VSFFDRFFGSNTPPSDDELRQFVQQYLDNNDLGDEQFLLPDVVRRARKSRPELYINNLSVRDYEIEEVAPPQVVVLVNRGDGHWSWRLVFEVKRSQGKLWVVPSHHGEKLDPWRTAEFLSDNFECIFVVLDHKDEPITEQTPMFIADALDGYHDIAADFHPTVQPLDDFLDELAHRKHFGEFTENKRDELNRLEQWIYDQSGDVVGYLLRDRRETVTDGPDD